MAKEIERWEYQESMHYSLDEMINHSDYKRVSECKSNQKSVNQGNQKRCKMIFQNGWPQHWYNRQYLDNQAYDINLKPLALTPWYSMSNNSFTLIQTKLANQNDYVQDIETNSRKHDNERKDPTTSDKEAIQSNNVQQNVECNTPTFGFKLKSKNEETIKTTIDY